MQHSIKEVNTWGCYSILPLLLAPYSSGCGSIYCRILKIQYKKQSLDCNDSRTFRFPICAPPPRFIDTLFPNLKTIEALQQHSADRWRAIFDLLKLCQAVRQDERQRFVGNFRVALRSTSECLFQESDTTSTCSTNHSIMFVINGTLL